MKLMPCKVPWALRPAFGFSLHHSITDDANVCTAFTMATRAKTARSAPQSLIGISFNDCWGMRLTDKACWDCVPTTLEFSFFPKDFNDCPNEYLDWYESSWKSSDYCPDPAFYFVPDSAWPLEIVSERRRTFTHFVLPTNSGYFEFLSHGCHWIEYNCTMLPTMNMASLNQMKARGEIVGITRR
jgi:hypothetical protein